MVKRRGWNAKPNLRQERTKNRGCVFPSQAQSQADLVFLDHRLQQRIQSALAP